ncbi:MAG: ATP-dependent ligase [Nocardioidaceae bacterium]|jgi:bifunctional non-homologous end joining protein LigD|nr:ATP-dependent ligase [Nocardioidaceae bacterium]
MPERETLEVDGRRLTVSNLAKVLYPGDGTTKHQVIEHYVRVAEVLLPQLSGRPATRKRWPDGTGRQPFFEKNAPRGTPAWVRTVTLDSPGSTRNREEVTYPVVEGLATLVWLANLAALELHTPQWTVGPRGGVRHPDRLVVDLDPGAPAGLAECAEVACLVRDRLAADDLETFPVTSGSKGLQLYAPISGRQDADVVRGYAHEMATELEAAHPRLIVSRMAKAVRGGKVFIDWSQNDSAKTTITPYSLRGLDRPFVAAPRTWLEVEDPGSLTQLLTTDLPERLDTLGDLAPATGRGGPRLP